MDKDFEILETAIKKYGIHAQTWMMVEECGELIDALAKFKRCRVSYMNIITELADVSIMVEQLAIYYGWDKFIAERKYKIARLQNRLAGEKQD